MALLLAAWAGVNAVWGITGTGDTLISGWERRLFPLPWWIALGTVLPAAAAVSAWRGGRRSGLVLGSLLSVWVPGTLAGRWLTGSLALPTAVERLFFAAPAVPMLVLLWVLREPWSRYPLRWGRWSSEGLLFGSEPGGTSYARKLRSALVFFLLPVAVLGQASVGFSPLLEGTLWPTLPGVVLLAAVNAAVEELLFRGLLLGALAGHVGVASAVWLQGLLFGLSHWGSSPALIAGLVMVPALTVLGAVWGKSAADTGGIGWSITVHWCLGVAYFSAILP